jgi:hypothetical protein
MQAKERRNDRRVHAGGAAGDPGLALVTVFMGVKVVPQGREYTVERFGRYTRTLSPGYQVLLFAGLSVASVLG